MRSHAQCIFLIIAAAALPVLAPGALGNDDSEPRAEQSWWAQPPIRTTNLPSVANPPRGWVKNPIDQFLYAKLEAARIEPGPPAEARALIRRIYFVLTGLPPAPGDVEAFARACALGEQEAATGRLADTLLASPQFGERWARHWMDVVRYSETHGTEFDPWLPHAWRYRDYLIRAFNDDLPYDQFVREHIAGDLLAKPRWNQALELNESLLATAWWRFVEFNQTPVDVKGEEVIVVDNQIDALGKAFLGLTIACARCHDHKFDPISQRDFHGLYSILASVRTSMRVVDPPEKLHAQDAELTKLKAELRATLANVWRSQMTRWPEAMTAARETNPPPQEMAIEVSRWRNAFARAETNKQPSAWWLKALRSGERREARRDSDPAPGWSNAVIFADFSTGSDSGWFGTGDFARPAPAGDFSVSVSVSGSNLLAAIYPAGRYSHLLSDKRPGTFRSPNFTITNRVISVLVTGDNNARVRLIIENFQGDSLLFEKITPKLADRTALRWITMPIRDNWLGQRAYLEAVPRDDMPYPGIVKDTAKVPADGRSAAGIRQVIFHDSGKPPEPAAIPMELAQLENPAEFSAKLAEAARRAVAAWAESRCDDAQALLLNSLLQAGVLENDRAVGGKVADSHRAAEGLIPVAKRIAAVTDEGPGLAEPSFSRGDPHRPRQPVPRHFLEVFKGGASYVAAGSGRLELADDIVASPLAARVMVNRLWHHVFGAGLVRTVDNFGKLGELPSHPELLDWLATEFQANNWSVKTMLRRMVTSRAFALAVDGPAAAFERDPDNRLLSHANLRRLDAESLRDAILNASGRFDAKMFGPSVPIVIPPGQRDDYSPADGPLDGRGRRSLYLETRRNHPHSFLFAFDQPKPVSPAGRRQPTNVPAQSLMLLNDPFVIEQAALFAARALGQKGEEATRIGWLYNTALCRPATDTELKLAGDFLARQKTVYDGDEKKSWRDLAQAIFNMKEFLYLK